MASEGTSRREFISLVAAAGTGLLAVGAAGVVTAQQQPKQGPEQGKEAQEPGEEEEKEEKVSPAEDLMREHGVLKRVLLVYAEAVRRMDAGQDPPPDAILDGANVIRDFIEDYHEKLEEDFLFPRFRQADTLVDLVDVLYQQHQAGRKLTGTTLNYAKASSLKDELERRHLRDSMATMVRMYGPHEAREDTVLFPAFRKLLSADEYDALGEQFETREHELFGEDGFEKMVDRVAGIEKALGIYDLAQFTPVG